MALLTGPCPWIWHWMVSAQPLAQINVFVHLLLWHGDYYCRQFIPPRPWPVHVTTLGLWNATDMLCDNCVAIPAGHSVFDCMILKYTLNIWCVWNFTCRTGETPNAFLDPPVSICLYLLLSPPLLPQSLTLSFWIFWLSTLWEGRLSGLFLIIQQRPYPFWSWSYYSWNPRLSGKAQGYKILDVF